MNQCTDPGCSGTIEDGYCTACGMAPSPQAPQQPAGPAAPGPAPHQAGPPPGGPHPAGPQGPPPRGQHRAAPPQYGAPQQPAHQAAGPPAPGRHGSGRTPSGRSPSGRTPSGRSPSGRTFSGRSGSGRSVTGSSLSGRSVSGAFMTGSTPSGRVGSARSGSSRGLLGMGMVRIPPVPTRDPSEALMTNPEVPEKDRYCGNCTEPVGRSREGRPGRVDGFCRNCGAEFSFTPKLKPGDLVAGQYEVLGAIAHGGLGWIYLARDRNVSDRWVVLKGLLNTGDAEAHKAAAAERAFLAQVEHPNIVKIINFVQHPDPKTGTPTGHIVMEYVGGRSLKELLSDRRKADGEHARLPLDQVIAYGLESLRALGYLHSKGLLYCDFKPDNIIQSEEQIKLLDLGGVRSVDDADSPVYATPGYRVPEAELLNPGPTISFDLYTVGRSLAVLSFPFSFMREHPHTLPPRESVPLLQLHESFDRFLRRSTHADMERRFHDSADMAEQLTGVLREVLATIDGQPRPAASDLFGPEHFVAQSDDPEHLLATPDDLTLATTLPIPLTDADDAFAGMLSGFTGLSAEELVRRLRAVSKPTTETRLMLTRALISLGNPEEAAVPLDEVEQAHPGDWRTSWYRALIALSAGAFEEAHDRYQYLYDHLPGEAAPKLGLAAACFGLGKLDEAARYYGLVWNTDYSFVSAAFGLARACLAQGDQAGAVDVLDSVPELSSLYLPAQMAAIVAQVGGGVAGFDPARLTEGHLLNAGRRLELLGLRGEAHNKLAAEICEAALRWTEAGNRAAPGTVLLNRPFTEDGLRLNLEDSFRGLARSAGDLAERNELIDEANRLRPRTWV